MSFVPDVIDNNDFYICIDSFMDFENTPLNYEQVKHAYNAAVDDIIDGLTDKYGRGYYDEIREIMDEMWEKFTNTGEINGVTAVFPDGPMDVVYRCNYYVGRESASEFSRISNWPDVESAFNDMVDAMYDKVVFDSAFGDVAYPDDIARLDEERAEMFQHLLETGEINGVTAIYGEAM